MVHRLVLETFVGPCPSRMECCHFPDRNHGNNRLENLRWDTHKNNMNDKEFHGTTGRGLMGLKGIANGRAKLTDMEVREIRDLYATKKLNQVKLAGVYKIDQTVISEIVRKVLWSHVI